PMLRHPVRRAQIAALRLAALLQRSRHPIEEVPLRLVGCSDARVQVWVDQDWLADHPLTQAALAEEGRQWELIGCELRLDAQSSVGRSDEGVLEAS
ncbi:MAG: hypothetical protein EBV57_05700, partial [Betaproteobacteria bacterium]|nr:hypothetical protein [Betaproteobacteria bacterium]